MGVMQNNSIDDDNDGGDDKDWSVHRSTAVYCMLG